MKVRAFLIFPLIIPRWLTKITFSFSITATQGNKINVEEGGLGMWTFFTLISKNVETVKRRQVLEKRKFK
jgi:hypothetical protein